MTLKELKLYLETYHSDYDDCLVCMDVGEGAYVFSHITPIENRDNEGEVLLMMDFCTRR